METRNKLNSRGGGGVVGDTPVIPPLGRWGPEDEDKVFLSCALSRRPSGLLQETPSQELDPKRSIKSFQFNHRTEARVLQPDFPSPSGTQSDADACGLLLAAPVPCLLGCPYSSFSDCVADVMAT